jgi:hypothetical protein
VEKIEYNVVQGKNSGEGSRWNKIGAARKHDTGFWLRMDVMPIPNSDGEVWLQLYERMQDEVSQKNGQTQKQENVHQNSYASKK